MHSLLAAILLVGSALGAPKPQTCTSKSTTVKEWKVVDFDFHASYVFTTPAHQNSWGYVNFTLENPILPYKATCEASSSQLSDFFYGNFPYNCTVPAAGDEATFTFSRPSGELKINQTWNCPYESSYFKARGGVSLNLNCKESRWENKDWTMGQIYSTRNIDCEHVTVKAPVTEMTGVA